MLKNSLDVVLAAHVGGKLVGQGGALRRRTSLGLDLWRRGLAPKLVFTGGFGEAVAAAFVARAEGVPQEVMALEAASTSTEENAALSRLLLGDVAVLVVTDGYHVIRTERVFRRHFSRADVVGATPSPLARAKMALREVVALAIYRLRGRL